VRYQPAPNVHKYVDQAQKLSDKGEYGRGDRFAFNLAMHCVRYDGVAGTGADARYVRTNDSLGLTSDPIVLSRVRVVW
jgi:hypothetical protein